jgi:hypothetical protein
VRNAALTLERSNFITRMNVIPDGCPPEFRKRILEIREERARAGSQKSVANSSNESLAAKAQRQAKEIQNDFRKDGRVWEETVENAETVQRTHRAKNDWAAMKKELGL